jgi:hypothetical protein
MTEPYFNEVYYGMLFVFFAYILYCNFKWGQSKIEITDKKYY